MVVEGQSAIEGEGFSLVHSSWCDHGKCCYVSMSPCCLSSVSSLLPSCWGCVALPLRLPALAWDLVEVSSFYVAAVQGLKCGDLGSESGSRLAFHFVCCRNLGSVAVEERPIKCLRMQNGLCSLFSRGSARRRGNVSSTLREPMSGFWSLCRLRDGSLLPWDLFPLLLMVRMIILGVAWVWEVSFGTRV